MALEQTDPAVPVIEEQVALLLRLADRSRRATTSLAHTLERSAYLALRLLDTTGPAGINEIADHLRLDASTVTRQVLAMEAAGYVTRERDAQDGRRAVVTTTPAGVAALAETRAARTRVYADVLTDWSTQDRAVLAQMLTRLNDDLDAHATRR